jgi:hypothetical protein
VKTPVKVEKANTGTTRSRLRLWPIVRTDYLHIHAENNEEGAEIHFGALILNLAPSPFFLCSLRPSRLPILENLNVLPHI